MVNFKRGRTKTLDWKGIQSSKKIQRLAIKQDYSGTTVNAPREARSMDISSPPRLDSIFLRIYHSFYNKYWIHLFNRICNLLVFFGKRRCRDSETCKTGESHKFQLEGLLNINNSPIFQTNSNVSGENKEILASRYKFTNSNRGDGARKIYASSRVKWKKRPKSRLNMAVDILEKDKYKVLNFMVPDTNVIILDFEASGPADLYLLNNDELNLFTTTQKRDFQHFALRRTFYYDKIKLDLPPGKTWYLVVGNPDPLKDIAIYYRVFNSQ